MPDDQVTPANVIPLALDEIGAARAQLGERIVTTPTQIALHPALQELVASGQLFLKLEHFQVTGSFKARGALLNVDALTEDQRSRGVTAISAGNHAIAVAYAARAAGTTARIVMTSSANRLRVEACRHYGADLVFAPDIHRGFELVQEIETREGRTLLHPFEGRTTALGTATVGWELGQQVPDLDAVIVPVGGGGLCAGVASAVKLLQPACRVFGVEPFGADSMWRSFGAGRPMAIDSVDTIADSLGAPYAMPVSFELCRRNVDAIVRVSDGDLRESMRLLAEAAKLAVEPAAAASLAALAGPLRSELAGLRVALIVCGSNIDVA
ncbi:MAG TPA: pyridoxal-phosphate dependent enzyme, partial [Steroidobacteraceae bacterium]|nr:pyridoxal-phosphate dependent enzyme [Steroidobacteraceae bacterium]